MGKQVRFDAEARESLGRGAEQLTAAVRVTLGPGGRNVVIDHGDGAPTITNDGLTIAREIELPNPFENMGVTLLREVAFKTGLAAGDGTTTATVIAGSVVTHGLRAIASGCNPVAVKRGIDRAVAAAVIDLRRQARSVDTRADILQVATVSSRGDALVGELIAEAMERVGRQGVITVGEGRGRSTTLEIVEGTRLREGYVSPYFVTNAEQMESALDNPFVLLADMRLTETQQMLPALELAARAGRPLLVIAHEIEGDALATLVVNRLRGTVASVAIRAPESGSRRREVLEDLAVLTGARLFCEKSGDRIDRFTAADFGRAGQVHVDTSTTLLTQGGGDGESIRGRLKWLRREAQRARGTSDRAWFERRVACLAGGVALVEVGAESESERQDRKSCIEDTLAATRSAVEEGVVTGGGVALLRTQPALAKLTGRGDEAAGIEIVMRALEEPVLRIAENAGEDGPVILARVRAAGGAIGFDALTGMICDLEQRGILDPVKVTRCALEHAASIGALVLTTDVIVVDAPPEETEGGEPEK